ncbi:unnamed protein product [Saccharomyces cerevisiae]|nr:unnamed protein product [Saccharomyces cerevisiae]
METYETSIGTQSYPPTLFPPPLGTGGFTTSGYIHALVDSTSNSNSNSNSNTNSNTNSNSDTKIPIVQISDDSHITHDSFKPYMEYHDATHLRNRNISKADQVDSTEVMEQFTQWSNYKMRSRSPTINAKPIRHTSQRRTDFTSKNELSKFSKNHNFIFHKGFLKRQHSIRREDRQAKVRSRFRSKKELTSVLNYIELEQMDIANVLASQSVNLHAIRNLTSRDPAVTPIPFLRSQMYATSSRPPYLRNRSIRRKLPKSQPGSLPTTMPATATKTIKQNSTTPTTRSVYNKNVGRSNTSPSVLYHPKRRGKLNTKSHARKEQLLLELWREYLMLVITQRTQLRLTLLCSPGSASNESSVCSSNASDLDMSLLSTPSSLFQMAGETKSNPIIIPDSQDDSILNSDPF